MEEVDFSFQGFRDGGGRQWLNGRGIDRKSGIRIEMFGALESIRNGGDV